MKLDPPSERPRITTPLPINLMNDDGANTQELRKVVKARTIARTVCITLPKELREALGIGANDRVMVQLDKAERRLIVTKE